MMSVQTLAEALAKHAKMQAEEQNMNHQPPRINRLEETKPVAMNDRESHKSFGWILWCVASPPLLTFPLIALFMFIYFYPGLAAFTSFTFGFLHGWHKPKKKMLPQSHPSL